MLMSDLSPNLLMLGFIWYVVFLFSTTCHEASHALAAKIGGDSTAALGGHRYGRVLTVASGEQLTGRIMGAVMSYVLVPVGSTTRLLLKLVTSGGRVTAPLLSVGDLVMARRQLLNLARLAERTAGS